MNKAILIIDMPHSCVQCPLFVTGDYGAYCVLDDTRNIKTEECPLKPAPEEQEVWYDDDDWVMGYNNCVHEIMGN